MGRFARSPTRQLSPKRWHRVHPETDRFAAFSAPWKGEAFPLASATGHYTPAVPKAPSLRGSPLASPWRSPRGLLGPHDTPQRLRSTTAGQCRRAHPPCRSVSVSPSTSSSLTAGGSRPSDPFVRASRQHVGPGNRESKGPLDTSLRPSSVRSPASTSSGGRSLHPEVLAALCESESRSGLTSAVVGGSRTP